MGELLSRGGLLGHVFLGVVEQTGLLAEAQLVRLNFLLFLRRLLRAFALVREFGGWAFREGDVCNVGVVLGVRILSALERLLLRLGHERVVARVIVRSLFRFLNRLRQLWFRRRGGKSMGNRSPLEGVFVIGMEAVLLRLGLAIVEFHELCLGALRARAL